MLPAEVHSKRVLISQILQSETKLIRVEKNAIIEMGMCDKNDKVGDFCYVESLGNNGQSEINKP